MWLLALLVVIEERHLEIIVWCLVVCHAWLAYEINVQYFSNGYVSVNEFRWNGLDSNTYSTANIHAVRNIHRFIYSYLELHYFTHGMLQ